MNGLKALLFDKDGTLIHFDRTWGPAAGEVMRELAGDDPQALRRLEEVSEYLPDEQRFLPSSPLVAGSSAHYGPQWAHCLGRDATDAFFSEIDRLFSREGLRALTPLGRPQDVLAHFHGQGLKLGIVTNDAEANSRLQAEALGLMPYLDLIHGYDSGFGSKPGPGMITAAAEALNVPPDSMAVIGDSTHDYAAAKAAGARFILVRTGPAPVEPLLDVADMVVDSIDDLPRRLAGAAMPA
ncbi:phosphatase [Azorhizobium oxalatiphilum]|uniref:phosphoglycolate phosphatase n=1 Tax=Azorhizobium oxalatiphilum TaxID=980631 RepID=A0A917CCB5_9HYPH|nr:HAD family hydrolase [Azorhizobium oxalatiphilum]GGF82837.1 phosphatase [Azorhizobium oxalatiphilum]